MNRKRLSSGFFALFLAVSIFTLSLPQIVYSQTSAKADSANDLKTRLSRIEAKVIKRQKELGIPGIGFAIVKDDKVIYSKGLGYKDFENKIPMTADTQLAIGSATKAFTGLSVLMVQDEGKVSLDDSPKKYLPYFKINNTETDKNITVRDLMAHSSGLNRTDLAMITGKLNRVELIKVAGIAKPMAGLRKRFYYQNIMYAAAGEIVSEVYGKSWKEFVPAKIFAPLGMTNSTMTVEQMHRSNDYSFGYSYNFDTKKTRKLPTRDIVQVAPAGSINSTANDMARWLRFILNGGELDGKRLVSKESFGEWIKPQMKITPNGKVAYGLGWFLQEWKGKKVVQHGGNIDGFNSMVATIPEENLGFVMLTNVSASSLGNELMQIVWSGILDDLNSKPLSGQAKKEVGKYKFPQAGFDIEVQIEDGKLVAKVPGQPTYILENVKDRKYKLANAPPGFFITFKDTEAQLEQPQGNFTLPKAGAAKSKINDTVSKTADKKTLENGLAGTYKLNQPPGYDVTISDRGGKLFLQVPNQPPYELKEREKDVYFSPTVPKVLRKIEVKRNGNGKITEFVSHEPTGTYTFKRIAVEKPTISIDELMTKTIAALGGEANMRKINSRVTEFTIDAVHQGVKGYGKIYQKTPNKTSSKTTLTALGKKIGWINEYFDGTTGGEEYSFSRDEEYTGKRLEDIKIEKSFYGFLDWKDRFEKLEIVKIDKVGDEKSFLVSFKPKKGNKFGVYISAKSFLPLKRSSVVVSSTSSQRIPVSERYEDYRDVDGLKVPFKIIAENPSMGEIITQVTKIRHNVKIPEKRFKK